MITPAFLIIFFTIFFVISFSIMLRRYDDLYALAYLTLFIYTIFTQIVYAYYPELSQNIGGNDAYFGPGLFYDYWLFMFLSFVVSFLVYLLLTPLRNRKAFYRVKEGKATTGRRIFYIFTILLVGTIFATYVTRGDEISYGGEENALINNWFAYGYRILALVAVVLYARYRMLARHPLDRRMALLLFLVSATLVFQISIKAGARSTLLYLAIGIATFELHPFVRTARQNKRKLLCVCFLIVPLLYVLSALEYVRSLVPSITFGDFWQVLRQPGEMFGKAGDVTLFLVSRDYYVPSHTLIVAMAYHIVTTIEVFKSNIANALAFLHYPTLGQTIVSTLDTGGLGRNAGWGFHFFTEGYVACGWLGIFYNAIVWNAGMHIWKRLASGEHEAFNRVVTALMAALLVSTMRSQSYWLIKYLWLFLIPVLGLLFLSEGWFPVVLRRTAALRCSRIR